MSKFITLLDAAYELAGPTASDADIHRWLDVLERNADVLDASRTVVGSISTLPGGLSYQTNRANWQIPRARFDKWRTDQEGVGVPIEVATDQPKAMPVQHPHAQSSGWPLSKPVRDDGLAGPIYEVLSAALAAGGPRPNARDVLKLWETKKPWSVIRVLPDGCDYLRSNGTEGSATLDQIRKRIDGMTTRKSRTTDKTAT